MDKQKAIQIIKDAPADWGFYNELTCSFFVRMAGIWYIYEGSWISHNPHPKAYSSMIPKSEILKIAEVETLKNAGDNLVLGCGDSKCDEWPQVGENVMFTDLLQHYEQYKDDYCNKVSKVIARFNSVEGEFITVHREYCSVMTVRVDRVLQDGALIKPKTPEEELRDDLTRVMQRNLTYKQIVDDLIENFNITKKP